MTEEERGHSKTLVYQVLPSRYGMNPDDLRRCDAIEVVVGLPLNLSGEEGEAAARARRYAGQIARRTGIPVRLVDERLTTVSAHQALRDSGRPGRRHRSVVDQVAATMILEQALAMERSTGEPAGELLEERR